MARDPRIFSSPISMKAPGCLKGIRAQTDAAHDAAYPLARNNYNTAGGAIGKVGDLEIWSKVGGGAGKVGEGLRTIASISNAVRSGKGVPKSFLGGGVDGVLGALEYTHRRRRYFKT